MIQRYMVQGMTCGHCAISVTKAVETLAMVERALVDLERGELTIEGEAAEKDIRDMVKTAGYEVTGRV